jgi:hypothetical protein
MTEARVGMTRDRRVVTGVGVVATTVGVPVRIEIREGARVDTVMGCVRVCVSVCACGCLWMRVTNVWLWLVFFRGFFWIARWRVGM